MFQFIHNKDKCSEWQVLLCVCMYQCVLGREIKCLSSYRSQSKENEKLSETVLNSVSSYPICLWSGLPVGVLASSTASLYLYSAREIFLKQHLSLRPLPWNPASKIKAKLLCIHPWSWPCLLSRPGHIYTPQHYQHHWAGPPRVLWRTGK